MNTRDKIHSAINEHIDVDDTYAYFLTRDKSSFSVGTVTLDDFEEWTDSDVADLTDSIMEKINTELNENQQVVLEWLKSVGKDMPIYRMADQLKWYIDHATTGEELDHALASLNGEEEFQVLAAFAEWGRSIEKSD